MGIVTELAAFLRARWDEEEAASALFHELDCPAQEAEASSWMCRCPCPVQIRERIAAYRRILADCEQRIEREQAQEMCWPLQSILAFKTMQALALPFELHPAWQDTCTPDTTTAEARSPYGGQPRPPLPEMIALADADRHLVG